MSSHALTALLPAAGLVPAAASGPDRVEGSGPDQGFGALFDALASALGRQGDDGGAVRRGADDGQPAERSAETPSPSAAGQGIADGVEDTEPGSGEDGDGSWTPVLAFGLPVPVPVIRPPVSGDDAGAAAANEATVDDALPAAEPSAAVTPGPAPASGGLVGPDSGEGTDAPPPVRTDAAAGPNTPGTEVPRPAATPVDSEAVEVETRPPDAPEGPVADGRDISPSDEQAITADVLSDRVAPAPTFTADSPAPPTFAPETGVSPVVSANDSPVAQAPSETPAVPPSADRAAAFPTRDRSLASPVTSRAPASPANTANVDASETSRTDVQATTGSDAGRGAPVSGSDPNGDVPREFDVSTAAGSADETPVRLGDDAERDRIRRVVRDASVRAARGAILDALQHAGASAGRGVSSPGESARAATPVLDGSQLLLDGTTGARSRIVSVPTGETGQSLEGEGQPAGGDPSFIDVADLMQPSAVIARPKSIVDGSGDARLVARVAPTLVRAAGDGPLPGSGFLAGVAGSVMDPVASSTPLNLGTPAGSLDGEVPQQIVRAIRLQWNQGVSEARLRLQPEHLGEVRVSLRVEHGMVRADLQADTAEVRNWIRTHEADLRRMLSEQGLDLDHLTVQDEPSSDDRHGQDDQRRHHRRAARASHGREAPRFEVRV